MISIATFRVQFFFPLRYGLEILFLCLFMFQLMLGPSFRAMMNNLDIVLECFLLAYLPAAVLFVIGVGLITWYFPITVFEEGLRCYDFWARYQTVKWDAMTQARTRNMAGMRYVCVEFEGSTRSLWIPKFLRRNDKFCELVKECAGVNNPLYRELIA